MPLGIVNETEFNHEINHLGIIIPSNKEDEPVDNSEIRDISRGRPIGKLETPEIVRETIALDKLAGVQSKQLQKEFNISASSVSAYAKGATSTARYNDPDRNLSRAIESRKSLITERAIDKLTEALESINLTEDMKPNMASMIAKDMSAIVKNMGPDMVINNDNRVVVFKPRMREEEEYQVIDVVD
jgi:predicted AlkP superfamily phosphohydrolase/phosphomutase